MDDSSSNVVKYTFQADTSSVEKGVDDISKKVDNLKQEMGDMNLKINWGEGEGTYEEYQEWFEKTTKEAEEYAKAQEEAAAKTEEVSTATRSAAPSIQEVGDAAEEATSDFIGWKESMYESIGSINDLDSKTQALFATIGASEVAFVQSSLDEYAKYEDALYGLMTTVDTVKGTIADAMTGIREITSNGLLSEEDTMVAMRNLTAYGYSVQEATEMIKAMTISAEANRKEGYNVSDAVARATQGIKQESSMMMKVAGNMETASDAEKRYAESIGKTASELTVAERRQAIYNSTIEAGQKYASQAVAYENSYSAASQRLSNSLENLRASFGQAFAPMMTFVANLASFVVQNQEVIVGIGTFVGVIVGAGGIIWALSKLIPLIATTISWFLGLNVATKGIILGLATVAAAIAVVNLAMSSTVEATQDVANASESASEGISGIGDAATGTAGAVRNLGADLEKLRRDYLEDLKQIEVRHLETIENLTKQIKEANVDYRRAVEERNAAFAVSQAEEERAHQEKVDEIMTQIAFLQRYNNEYNRQKLSNLEFALAKENNLYQRQTEAAKEELELQNENDRKAYEEKRAALQAELDDELAFMNKHRDALKEVQDVILLDEIEALQRRYEEQKASYAEQGALATGAGGTIGQNLTDAFEKAVKGAQTTFANLGELSANTYSGNFIDNVNKALTSDHGFFAGLSQRFYNLFSGAGFTNEKMNYVNGQWVGSGKYEGWATGGYTGSGDPDDIAGVVHKGEYVLPAELVDQATGTPKTLGMTINNYVTVEGVFATSSAERRRVADQIVEAINQNNRSRLLKGVGV